MNVGTLAAVQRGSHGMHVTESGKAKASGSIKTGFVKASSKDRLASGSGDFRVCQRHPPLLRERVCDGGGGGATGSGAARNDSGGARVARATLSRTLGSAAASNHQAGSEQQRQCLSLARCAAVTLHPEHIQHFFQPSCTDSHGLHSIGNSRAISFPTSVVTYRQYRCCITKPM